MPDYKNNHYVPRRYLRRFASLSEAQVALYVLKNGTVVPGAGIDSQCSEDYFYTKDPKFEQHFTKLEEQFFSIVEQILTSGSVPLPGSDDRRRLSFGINFQSARTAAAAVEYEIMANDFGKAMLRHKLEHDGNHELLKHLPDVEIKYEHAVMEVLASSVALYPLLDDLDCTLLLNESSEDFLTSDHPVALCSALPDPQTRFDGLASRGLIILYPITPRAMLFFGDAEAYLVQKNSNGASTIASRREVVGLNLAQCREAHQTLYFARPADVRETLSQFEKRRSDVRPPMQALTERPTEVDGRRLILLERGKVIPRLALPRAVSLRSAIRTGRFKLGDMVRRDPLRVAAVKAESDRINALREAATRSAEQAQRE